MPSFLIAGRWLFLAALLLLPCLHGPAQAQPRLQAMQSAPRQGEVDTADKRNGQVGGNRAGLDYAPLRELRCPDREAIVGLRIGHGDVLESIGLTCAPVTCTGDGCRWTASHSGPVAGSTRQAAQPAMDCGQDEMVSGIRRRVRNLSAPGSGHSFDYAADIAVECARITAQPPDTPGAANRNMFGVAGQGRPLGNLANEPGSQLTGEISCRPNGGATAISLGVSRHVQRRGERIIQAVSLYCPATSQAPDPNCPDDLLLQSTVDRFDALRIPWFGQRSGRTGGAIATVMQAQPATRNWQGTRITESLAPAPGSQCPAIIDAAAFCGTGDRRSFTLGQPSQRAVVDLRPRIGMRIPSVDGPPNSFVDVHMAADTGRTAMARARNSWRRTPMPPAAPSPASRPTSAATGAMGPSRSATASRQTASARSQSPG